MVTGFAPTLLLKSTAYCELYDFKIQSTNPIAATTTQLCEHRELWYFWKTSCFSNIISWNLWVHNKLSLLSYPLQIFSFSVSTKFSTFLLLSWCKCGYKSCLYHSCHYTILTFFMLTVLLLILLLGWGYFRKI